MKTVCRLLMILMTLLLLYVLKWLPVPLPLFSAQDLKVKDINLLQKLTSESHEIQLLKMSADGKWVAVKKVMDSGEDTLIILRTDVPESIALKRTHISDLQFLVNNRILLLDKDGNAEYLSLREQKKGKVHEKDSESNIFVNGTVFTQIKKIESLKNGREFLLWSDTSQKNSLSWFSAEGNLLRVLEDVTAYVMEDNSDLYTVQEKASENKKDKWYSVFRLSGFVKQLLYQTNRPIEGLHVVSDTKSLISFEKDPTGYMKIVCTDLNDFKSYPLDESLLFHHATVKSIGQGKQFFISTINNKTETKNPSPEVWYGDDTNLEEKFLPQFQEKQYFWEPESRKLENLNDSNGSQKIIPLYNQRYFLAFNPGELKDYTEKTPSLLISVYDRISSTSAKIDTVGTELYTSAKGEYLLYPGNKCWKLYQISDGKITLISKNGVGQPYFTRDGKGIVFGGNDALWYYDIRKGSFKPLTRMTKGFQYRFIDGERESLLANYGFYRSVIDDKSPLIVEYRNEINNRFGYERLHGNKRYIVPPSDGRISSLLYNPYFSTFAYIQENYNMPPRVVITKDNKSKVIYQSNPQDTKISKVRMDVIKYIGAENTPLKGLLYYPRDYRPSLIYSMVVHIYESQHHLSSQYWRPTYKNSLGFNVRLLQEKGYFVFLPDIAYGKEGPGISALQSVEASMKAVLKNKAIDSSNVGLIGQSFGGYQTNFIATHSNLFKAYVSGAANADIVHVYHTFNESYHMPEFWRYESGQYRMGKSFSQDKELYFRNNPLYGANRVTSPMLLWCGMQDKNVNWEETRTFYNALKRNKKQVVALFYPDDGHGMWQETSKIDLTYKIMDWFDFYLKDSKIGTWISNK
ncbi:dipeptidyl aminopeptidase/acylaminoacyl peptidase [Chryseobacterium defluvii]|uniref:Dipeptidyl aminopeptidase/acylaminoacyl peptidase n=1 Tax=Chryseobacterium defluvii TaxID=160396 RepID=A0A840KH01_9FLAO|nr:prolyl oligopeptidase family serine peptidase [Chryseobacterium defluvii]MBB4807227.1 dipeptidyl aminopeptidase/acylaminoacyl peptidase [Chryseobacterium defluvii]